MYFCIFNVNESFTGRLFSNYGPLNMLFHFFRYLIYSVFHKTFVKKFMKKLSFFSSNFKNLFQDVVYYRTLGCLTLWYWNGGSLNIRQQVEKYVRFGGCSFTNKKMLTFWIFMNQIFWKWFLVSHKMTYMGLLLSKLRAVELESRTESGLSISNWYIF